MFFALYPIIMGGGRDLRMAVADLHSKILDTRPPGVQIPSISCSFGENLAKSYVGAPPGELAPPPWGASWIRH